MPDINQIPGLYSYKHLPLLAKFILSEQLEEYAAEQLRLSRQYKVPLLKLLESYSEAQLIEIATKSVVAVLRCLESNKGFEYIENSLQKWVANQLEVVGKYDIVVEDISLLNHVRGKNLKSFALRFYKDSPERYELLDEIDDFLLASSIGSSNTFITILKDRLKEEEEFRSKLSNALPGFIYIFDTSDKKVVYSNDKLKEILGYSREQLEELSKDFYRSITHPDDQFKIYNLRNSHSGNNEAVHSFELRLKDTGDSYKWLRIYETNLRSSVDGEIEEIIGVAFDVTGEKEITEALATREAQLLEAQSLANIGSFEWDITGHKPAVNTPEIYNIFEFGKGEKFEQFMQHVHVDDVQMVENALRESFNTGDYECIYRYLRNGKEKVIWSKGVVTIENGVAVKMVGTVQDVTDIKRIEAELKEKTIELEKSNESLQQFASIASHDLKEPLRKISILSSRILNSEKDFLSEASGEALHKILDSARRMQQMINDILQFSFIDAEQQKQETNLEELLSDVKELLSENISDKKAVISSDGLPYANVIAAQIRQVFLNLIANALKFSKENEPPVIRITHSYLITKQSFLAEERQLEISIADNGIGFAEKDQENVFALFYRLHNRTRFEGSGLGLSICKKIVEKHGGKISAQSKIGEGSVFKIILPVAVRKASEQVF